METQEIIKFKQKYRIQSARLKNYDYSCNGSYFITICAKNHEHFFGEIKDGNMRISSLGKIVGNEWEKTGKIRKHIFWDEWVIMPNHLHGIIMVNYWDHGREKMNENFGAGITNQQKYHGDYPKMSQISPSKNSIATAIRFFKRQTTILCRKIQPDFTWQPRFYDRVIRNEDELFRIRTYIRENPKQWEFNVSSGLAY